MTPQPAPGSDVPGAPPALRRGLGPSDGEVVHETRTSATAPPAPALPSASASAEVLAGMAPYLAALGLAVAAAIVEVGTWRQRRTLQRRST